jgi:CheY-like chemotaxis protein
MEPITQMEKTAAGPAQRVLVVDDDVELCQLISQFLGREGLSVEAVHTGQKASNALFRASMRLSYLT